MEKENNYIIDRERNEHFTPSTKRGVIIKSFLCILVVIFNIAAWILGFTFSFNLPDISVIIIAAIISFSKPPYDKGDIKSA